MEELKKDELYDIEWVDGYFKVRCKFVKTHRNFHIFIDENDMKVICRPESIKSITKVTQ